MKRREHFVSVCKSKHNFLLEDIKYRIYTNTSIFIQISQIKSTLLQKTQEMHKHFRAPEKTTCLHKVQTLLINDIKQEFVFTSTQWKHNDVFTGSWPGVENTVLSV